MTTVLTKPRPRILIAVGCLLAALVVALLPVPPGTTPAAAATGEDSAVTKSGKKGKYDDFSDLKVTVHQTKNLRSQSVRVSWEGGAPTAPSTLYNINYLQIMQCWGDDPSGPDREQCAFGAATTGGAGIGRVVRYGTGTLPGSDEDPEEDEKYTGSLPFVPFRPANGEPPTTSATDYTYFGPLDTNEQKAVRTFANGTGETEFEVQDGIQADYLGCGVNAAAAGNTPAPRPCWLVVVPRGTHDANGVEITNPDGTTNQLRSSPLSATNWAQRMVFRLDFQPVDEYCPEGQPERAVPGSELADDAVSSWAPKLCTSTGNTFTFNRGPEDAARNEVLSTTEETPAMGITVDPVAQSVDGPRVVHAPVAVSGLVIAFFIETPSGVLQEMKLTPRLVAKMLTHSYVRDVPWTNVCNTSPCPPGEPAPPEHLKDNPLYYTLDEEFLNLNPEFAELRITTAPLSLMVPQGNSDTARVIWNWLQSDKEARDFLSGKPDPHGMVVNKYYKDLDLADLTDYPKSDPTVAPAIDNRFNDPLSESVTYTILDLDPYTADLHDGAVKARRGNSGRTTLYAIRDGEIPAKVVNVPPTPGFRSAMAIVDAASAERYGLQTAALRNGDGNFVKPSGDTLQAGVNAMQPWSDNSDVLKPDPARAKGRAYPLTAVTYAAASVNQDAKDRKAYAEFIRYAAGPGQTQGLSVGELPPATHRCRRSCASRPRLRPTTWSAATPGAIRRATIRTVQGDRQAEPAPAEGPPPVRPAGERPQVDRAAATTPARRRRQPPLRMAPRLPRQGLSRMSHKPSQESHPATSSALSAGSFLPFCL
ncbi:hypothetical protein QQY66_30925 [Streptomyces sp. DG2A-72]|uniref:hypothetical protein n=1 Tax=Streptomyces sp. DG2A-72 TaxID=3051386 RepID=UPI00265B7CED|nr:hypothetical protein [Streptomyces sp. DG2A-72]MDO0935886.1 hypothetical protein [Streptomyces sp. DG2A-72]